MKKLRRKAPPTRISSPLQFFTSYINVFLIIFGVMAVVFGLGDTIFTIPYIGPLIILTSLLGFTMGCVVISFFHLIGFFHLNLRAMRNFDWRDLVTLILLATLSLLGEVIMWMVWLFVVSAIVSGLPL